MHAHGTRKNTAIYSTNKCLELFMPKSMIQYTIKTFMLEYVHVLHYCYLIIFQFFKNNPQTG